MGLVEADLDPGVCVSMGTSWYTFTCPFKDHPLATHSEPSALYCWILEILNCNPKGRRALLRIPTTEGRSVCLCWAKSKPKGPKGSVKSLSRLMGYRVTLLMNHKKTPPPKEQLRALGTGLLQGPWRLPFLMSEVTLYGLGFNIGFSIIPVK